MRREIGKKKWMLLPVCVCILFAQIVPAAENSPVKCLMIGMEPHGEANIMVDTLSDIEKNYPVGDSPYATRRQNVLYRLPETDYDWIPTA